MALKTDKELKLYYSISEVAKMFDVNESLLRYWEKEFPMISPKKTGGECASVPKRRHREHSSGISSGERKRDDAGRCQATVTAEQGRNHANG